MTGYINASIVRYNQAAQDLIPLINSLLEDNRINKIYLIDNSPLESDELKNKSIEYLFVNKNLGYGKAHNLAIRLTIEEAIPYHLVLNPDIQLKVNSLEILLAFMQSNTDIGLVMPKLLYPDETIQYLCKKLSTPFDLFGRRFLPSGLKMLFQKHWYEYELMHKDYNTQMDVPNLSGCFMFMRTDVLKQVGGFDERFFMYLEDIDLTRRIGAIARTVYYPSASVYHGYAKESYTNPKLLLYHIKSAIAYFNKWGWFFDPERARINALYK